MSPISNYHRPGALDEALALLGRDDVRTAPLGGGTVINDPTMETPDEVVDLQALGLDIIRTDGGSLVVGSMARLQAVVEHDSTPPILRELAHRELPSTLRRAATLGGTIAAADPESGFLAGLLAYDAAVTIASRTDARTLPLRDLLADRSLLAGAIITSVAIGTDGTGAVAATGRTPADTPIVLVAGRRSDDGVRLAATGVAATPVVIDPARLGDLDPPGDFRGSPEYRRHLVDVLSGRVMAALFGEEMT